MEKFSVCRVFAIISAVMIISAVVTLSSASLVAEPYSRSAFPHWVDEDGDGLDTRQELLKYNKLGEYWVCPYTGYKSRNPLDFQVDHLVPLKQAWDLGASTWSVEKRTRFANDIENLELVKGSSNSSKGDSPINQWVPLNIAYIPTLVERYKHVCTKYELKCDDPDPDGIADSIRKIHGFKYKVVVGILEIKE